MKPVNAFEVDTFGSGLVLAKTKYQLATPPFEILKTGNKNVNGERRWQANKV